MDGFGVLAAAFVIGIAAGLRSLTAPAVASLAARFGWLGLGGTPLGFMGSAAAAAVFPILAAGEYVYDLLPVATRRTEAMPLIARIVMGGLSGACIAAGAGASLTAGAVAGGVGGLAGAFGGYIARKNLVRSLGVKDAAVAIPEDLVAIGLAVLAVAMV